MVSAAFKYAKEHDVPLSAFLGDTCATLKMHPELEVRHVCPKRGVSLRVQGQSF